MRSWILLPLGLAVLAGCPDDDEIPGPPTELPTSGSGGGGPTVTTGSTGGMGGMGGAGGMGTGATGSTGGAGAGGDATGGMAGAGGGQAAMIHGCTPAMAEDMTGMGTLTLDDWTFNHQRCIRVSTNTVITWETSSFTTHPLIGGERPATDAASPITVAGSGASGMTSVDVTFPNTGTFPYWCSNHQNMNGVIYVE